MITYRDATLADAEQIAQLHSLSWQQSYRGIWNDDFLDNHVLKNRRSVWSERLAKPEANQYVIVAEAAGEICGFACAYAHSDAQWGTLLDNLHVHKQRKGQGIGTQLIKQVARWAYEKNPDNGFYLWVLTRNANARRFYDNLGAVNHEQVSLQNPDRSFSDCCRYVWTDITRLL